MKKLGGCALLLVLAGCGGSPVAPAVPAPAPAPSSDAAPVTTAMPALASTSCMLHESAPGRRPLPLLHDGRMFAVAWTKAAMGDVAIHLRDGTKGGAIAIANEHFVVHGDIPLGEVTVHPKKELVVDGWVRVETLSPDLVRNGTVTFTPPLPAGVTTQRSLAVTLSCADVTLHHASRYKNDGSLVQLKRGVKAKLYRGTGGAAAAKEPVADWHLPKSDDPKVDVARQLERSGKRVRLAIDTVDAWTDAAVLSPKGISGIGVGEAFQLAVPEDHVKVDATESVQCRHDVALHLPTPDGAVRVGTVHAGAALHLAATEHGRRALADVPMPNESDEPVWVGKHRVFVEASALAGCTSTPVRESRNERNERNEP